MHDTSFDIDFGNLKLPKFRRQALTFAMGASLWLAGTALAAGDHGDHGAAKVSISIEGNKSVVVLEISSEDAYGLEKAPASANEKQKAQEAVDKVTKNVSSMIVFDPSLGCTWLQKSIEPWKTREGDSKNAHGELHGEWEVNCKTKVEGSRLKFGLKKVLSAINAVEVSVNKGGKSLKNTIKRDRGSVTL